MELPDLRSPGPLDLARGFAVPFQALGLLFSTPRLKALTLLVAALTAATLIGLGIGLWHWAPALADWLWAGSQSWWSQALHGLLIAVLFVALFVAGANVLPLTLAAPLMDPISVQTEISLGLPTTEGGLARTVRELVRSVLNALLRVAVLAMGYLALAPLWLVPGIGGPLWTGAGFLWTSLWIAGQYLDVPMARHLYSFGQELSLLRRRKLLSLGFGAAISLLLWIPLLNFFFVPVAVIAGTLLFQALRRQGALEPPAGEARGSRAA